MTRSTITNKFDYRSMLVGNIGYVPFFPTMFFPGESSSTAIDKMLYSTETFSVSSSTLTFSVFSLTAFNDGSNFGYALASSNAVNKFAITTEAISTLSTVTSIVGTHKGGKTSTAGYYITNAGSSTATSLVNIWAFSTDTVTTSTALQSFTNIGQYSNYTFSNSPSIYFGGGSPAGTYYYGGLVRFNTIALAATSLWADVTATSRGQTSGAENGTTAAYLGGGVMMPYITFPTNILKIVYATDSTYSTLSATLSSARSPARVGVQAGVCAYYAGGRASSSSVAPIVTTVEKLTYSTETRSMVSTASVSRTGLSSWNT